MRWCAGPARRGRERSCTIDEESSPTSGRGRTGGPAAIGHGAWDGGGRGACAGATGCGELVSKSTGAELGGTVLGKTSGGALDGTGTESPMAAPFMAFPPKTPEASSMPLNSADKLRPPGSEPSADDKEGNATRASPPKGGCTSAVW